MKDEIRQVIKGAGEMHEQEPYSPERRKFLEVMCFALGGLVAGLVAIPVIGVYLSPMLKAPSGTWRRAGPVHKFTVGQTVEVAFQDPSPLAWAGGAGKDAVWLRRVDAQNFVALSIYCQHLGCPVRWLPSTHLFMCPCHGGVYYADGKVAAGPPPRGLQHFPVRVRNGQVEVFTGAIPTTY